MAGVKDGVKGEGENGKDDKIVVDYKINEFQKFLS